MPTRSFTSNSKKIALAAVIAALLAASWFALGELYAYAAGQNRVNEYNRLRFEEFYAAEPGSVDWVFLGSSHAYCTFNPANFDAYGVNAFQMGMPLQLLDGTYYTLTEILQTQRPDTVVLDLYWYVLEQAFDIHQMKMLFDVLRDGELKARYLDEALPWNEKIKYGLKPVRYQADFFAFVNDKLTNVLDYRFGLRRTPAHGPGWEAYAGRGYVAYDYTMTDRQYAQAATQPVMDMRDWQMAENQARYLEAIADLCAERGIRLVLTTAPVSNIQFSRIAHYEGFHDIIERFAQDRGLPYLDFNLVNQAAGLFDDACFFDAGHLNDRGVRLADAYFANWMMEL